MPVVDKLEIDLRLFAQIQDDPFLTGTYHLQGESFERSIPYLFQYVDQCSECPDVVQKLKPTLSYLANIERRIAPGTEATQDLRKLFKLASAIASDIQGLPMGESIAIPGGWANRSGAGHGMVYQWTRTLEGLEFSIFNAGAGAGAKYHEQRSAKDRELFYPIQIYKINLARGVDDETKQKLSYFLNALLIPSIPALRKDKKDAYFDEKKLYEEVIPHIYYLDAQLISSEVKGPHTLTSGQLSGTCAVRCLHQMLKANFPTLEAYQRFIYDFKRYALDDFMQVLLHAGKQKQNVQAQVQVKHAINNLKRILNLPGLFLEDFIVEEVRRLNEHLQGLETLQDHPVPEKRPEPKGQVQAEDADLNIGPIPVALVPIQKRQVPGRPLPRDELDPILGGTDLFNQLRELEQKIKRLMASGQYLAVIEGLELIFVSFPLSPGEKDYYQAINQQNQTNFYKAMNRLYALYVTSVHAVAKDVALPRMWAVSVSLISVLDTVSKPLSFGKQGSPTFQGLMAISSMSRYNHNNAYLATNNPTLDARIVNIQQRYQQIYQSKHRYSNEYRDLNDSVVCYYKAILASEPDFNEQSTRDFHTRFPWKTQAELGNKLINRGLQALYPSPLKVLEIFSEMDYK